MKTIILGLFVAIVSFQSTNASALASVLVFNGTGVSPTDVVALQSILKTMGLSYDTASSAQINAMPRSILITYKLIVWPGGNSIIMGRSLTVVATRLLRKVVVENGVSYIGFCAGAFMAESSYMYNVFNLAPTWFDFYKQSVTDMTWTTFADGSRRSLVYWDGPHLKGFGKVIAKYPNGLPAIAASAVGNGFVLLSGVHPEAPADWRHGFATPDYDGITADISLTKDLISSALFKVMPPHF